MSSDILARVEALSEKADGLFNKGHLMRAAENYGRAAEAARALGVDNVVTIGMNLRRSTMLSTHDANASQGRIADPRFPGAHRTECLALLSGAVTVLDRRRVAGTLLEGKCAAVEEVWYTHDLQQRMSAAETAGQAKLVGYDQFLLAAANALVMLLAARSFAAVCSAAQFQAFAQHVAHAVELMIQRDGNACLDGEAEVALFQLRSAVTFAAAIGLDERSKQLLAGALERLQRSGVLQARHMVERMGPLISGASAAGVAIQSSLNAPGGLRHCALPGCGSKEAHPAHFKSCAACRAVVYCCRKHQVEGWPSHKKACKAARKAQAEEYEAGPSGA